MQQLNQMRDIHFIAIALTSALILLLWVVAAPILPSAGQPQSSTFEQVWQTVNDDFCDPDFNGVNWTCTPLTISELLEQPAIAHP